MEKITQKNLVNKTGKILCYYLTDNTKIISINGVSVPADFKNIFEWIVYHNEINKALLNLGLIIK
jgi:hypothetical protein